MNISARAKEIIVSFFEKFRAFEVDEVVKTWWHSERKSAKFAFLSAFIIGFVVHLFVYTYRYFGNHDFGMAARTGAVPGLGRPFSTIITYLVNHGYVLPLTVGLLVSFFLAVAAFYFCKIFSIEKNVNGFLVALLLSTFPAISNINLFLYDSPNYFFAVPLAVIAVYLTVRYKWGPVPGAILLMLTLAIYQAMFNVAAVLCVLFLLSQLVNKDISGKTIAQNAVRFVALGGLGAIFYVMLLRIMNITLRYHGITTIHYRIFSISDLSNALLGVFTDFHDIFLGNMFTNNRWLRLAYLLLGALLVLLLIAAILRNKIYRKPIRLATAALLVTLIPLSSLFASALDTVRASPPRMVYPVVFALAFVVVMRERYVGKFNVLKSLTIACLLFISLNFIVINNIFYLSAFFLNQRMNSVSIQLMTDIAPLISHIESNQVAVFGDIENDSPLSVNTGEMFNLRGGFRHEAISHAITDDWRRGVFLRNINNLHGSSLDLLPLGEERDEIRQVILDTEKPVWPTEGSVSVINDVIVVNLGVADE